MKIKEWLVELRCRCCCRHRRRYRLLICAFPENQLSKLEPCNTNTNAQDWKLWKVTTVLTSKVQLENEVSLLGWVDGWMNESYPSQVYKYRMERDRKKLYAFQDNHASHLSYFICVYFHIGSFAWKIMLHTHIHNLSNSRLPHKRFIIYILLE